MFSATVHIQHVSQSPVKIYSATNIRLYISNAAVHVCVHGRVLTLKLVFSVQGLLLVFPRQSLSSAFQCARLMSDLNRCLTASLLWLVLVTAFVPVFHCGSHHEVISENSPGRLLHSSGLCTSTHRNIRINTLTAEVQNETNICQLTASFAVLPVARTPPSSLLSTSMKSFFETEQRIFAFFLSDPPASFTFSCTVFWCFLTALNS